MLDRLRDLFSAGNQDALAGSEDAALEEVVPLAAATILLEVAWADHNLEEKELNLIRDSLLALYGVSLEKANVILERAQSEHRSNTSLYPFTRQLNERLTIEERKELLMHLWRLNSFDGSPFHYEESVIRKTAELLNLRHSEFIEAKLLARSTN